MFKTATFEVVGDQKLVCEGCEQRVQNALKALPGVRQVWANASNQRVEVLFDTAKLDTAAIAERISRTGYQTKIAA